MKTRILAIILVTALCFPLAACAEGSDVDTDTNDTEKLTETDGTTAPDTDADTTAPDTETETEAETTEEITTELPETEPIETELEFTFVPDPKKHDQPLSGDSHGLEYELTEKGFVVTGIGTSYSKNISIPSYHQGVPVVAVADRAFYRCDGLKSVTIHEGVSEIGDHAFSSSSSLKKVSLNEGLLKIGNGAFANIPLSEITIPESVTEIGTMAFYSTDIRSLFIPKNVDTLGTTVVGFCKDLTELTVSDENRVFHSKNNCIIETETKTLHEGISCSVIPDDGSVTVIGDDAFMCSFIKTIEIPNCITKIGFRAFVDTEIQELRIPEGVETLDCCIVDDCTKLKTVYLPKTIKEITQQSIICAPYLEAVYYDGTLEEYDNIPKERYWIDDIFESHTYRVICNDGEAEVRIDATSEIY